MATQGGVPQIQVFRPTWEEFKDFNKYIVHMESKGLVDLFFFVCLPYLIVYFCYLGPTRQA